MLKLPAIVLLILATASFSKAQDTTKVVHKVTPVVKPAANKPAATTPGTVKPYTPRPYTAKPTVPGAQGAYGTKPAAAQPYGTYKPATVVQPGQPVIMAPTPISTDKSLGGQYNYILTKVFHYQQPMVAAFWKNVNDTLTFAKSKLKETQDKLSIQTKKLTALQADDAAKDQTLSDSKARVDSILMFGMAMSKATYNLVMWGLVIGMGIVLAIVIFTTARSRYEAKYRTKLYDELSEEFQTYKTKANDKEKKLARELQTERNKVDELMGRA